MTDDNGMSRRMMVGSATLGLAAAVTPAMAAAQPRGAPPPSDPGKKFPAPLFAEQSQPWPGLASRMQPRPDHGETSYKGSGRLAGRRALITGGDSGMGRAAAIAFAREGADVAISYYPTEEPDAREVVDLIRQAGRRAATLPGDLRDERYCRRLVADAARQLGGLDILVLNAARQQTRPSILDVSDEDFDATMKTNIYAPFWNIKAALPLLPPGSTIIATTSEQAYDPSPDLYDYAQTKAATMNYVKSLAKQLAPRGIRVNGVAPATVVHGSAMFPRDRVIGSLAKYKLPYSDKEETASLVNKLAQFYADRTLTKAPITPADQAEAYFLLVSDRLSKTCGQVVAVDGGLHDAFLR